MGGCKKGEAPSIVDENFKFAQEQLAYAVQLGDSVRSLPQDSVTVALGGWTNPRTTLEDGSLGLVPSKDWCSGFFPGELWFLYEYTHDARWKQEAERHTCLIEREKWNGKTHDMGFKMMCSYGNGYRLTANPVYKEVLLQSARTLDGRFKESVGCIRSWDHHAEQWEYPVIIDNMLNLELLFWAFRETGDSTFYRHAVSHAFVTLKNHFREDASSYHVVNYDTVSGQPLCKVTHQGCADGSAWSRGQAWGLYGYTMCYRETKMPEFLEQAKRIERFLFTHPNMPEDLVPYWDFDAPDIPDEPRDASAAACIASGLYELSLYVPENAALYRKEADTILENLTRHYRARWKENNGFLLEHSTGSKPHDSEIDVPLVYADYYFLEALLRKQQTDNN